MAGGWNFGDVWFALSERYPDAPALVHGTRTVTWREFSRRAGGVAAWLRAVAGLSGDAKVAQYLTNRPEYLESVFACFRGAFVPVNTNYRYTGTELDYLWRDADVEAVVFEASFSAHCDALRGELPAIRAWLCVDDGSDVPCPTWATSYEDAVVHPVEALRAVETSGDDQYLLYTGGTTGMPKGVMWRQDDLFAMLEEAAGGELSTDGDARRFVTALSKPGPRVLTAAPLMHGTASFFCMSALSHGGAVVTIDAPRFDAAAVLDAIVADRATGICIVGDAFAQPLLRALDEQPDRWDMSHVRLVFSSGVMLSAALKKRLLAYAPRAHVVDSLGSSESGIIGRAVTDATRDPRTASFKVGTNARVIDDDGRDIPPGSGRAGRLAVTGRIPLGYYKDPDKTRATFLEIDGRRHVVAGDSAEVAADGAVTLLGRGSACINTAGEKVYPEEVEEVMKTAPGVADAAVVGAPDERFGERVVALIELDPHAVAGADALIAHARQRLAGYKVPKDVIFVDTLGRSPSGKLDLVALRERAQRAQQ